MSFFVCCLVLILLGSISMLCMKLLISVCSISVVCYVLSCLGSSLSFMVIVRLVLIMCSVLFIFVWLCCSSGFMFVMYLYFMNRMLNMWCSCGLCCMLSRY